MSALFAEMFGARSGHFKRAQRGLYGGKQRITGNNVSFSERKTRRIWLPNVQFKRVFSDALDECVRIRLTTYTLRCIDKAGGLDNYLLHTKPKDLASEYGMELRYKVQEALMQKELLAKAEAAGAHTGPVDPSLATA